MDKKLKNWTYGIYFGGFGALLNASVVLIMILSGNRQIAMNLILFLAFSGLTALGIHKRRKIGKQTGHEKSQQTDKCDFCDQEGIICRDFTYYSCKTFFEGSTAGGGIIEKFYRHEDFKSHRFQMCKRCLRKETFIPLFVFLSIFVITVTISLLSGMGVSDVLTLGAFLLVLGLIGTVVISSSSLRNKPQKKALKDRKKEEKKKSAKKGFKITVMTPDEYRNKEKPETGGRV
jgi:membrane protein implicated in regulation of membrane protease activity